MKKDSLGLYCSHESDKEVDASKNDVNSCLRFLYVKLRVVRNCSNLIEKRNDKMEKELQQRAPIYEALERFRRMRIVPFDVPGHKHGRGNPELVELLGEKCVGIDVNSMKPLDNLCHPVSVIKEAEELAARCIWSKTRIFNGWRNNFFRSGNGVVLLQKRRQDHTSAKRTSKCYQCSCSLWSASGICESGCR